MNTERSKPSPPGDGKKPLNGNGKRITPATLIPIGSALAVIVALFAGYRWMDERFDLQDSQITAMTKEIKYLTDDRWRGSDMKLWTEMYLRLNPDQKKESVPDPWVILDRRKGK